MAPRVMVIVGGSARHGKDTLSDLLAEMIPDARRDAFANPMKEAVHLKTGIPMDVLNGPTGVKDNPDYGRYGKSPREHVILEGNNGREIDANYWADSLLHRFRASQEKVTIISDCRIPHVEGTKLRETLGKAVETLLVLVRRPSVPVKRGHVTEDLIADVDPSLFDYVIVNDGTLDDLRKTARQLADMVVLRAKTRTRSPKGFFIVCLCGHRQREPFVLREDAEAPRIRLEGELCPGCCCETDRSVEPCTFDKIDAS